jgi:hypothetical protein
MGKERECKLRYGGETQEGKAYLETDYVLFRGNERLKVAFKDLKGVKAERGLLRLEFTGGPAVLELGKAAEKWADKILHPPSRLDKLGIKRGTKIQVIGPVDRDFLKEAKAGGAVMDGSPADLVLFAANQAADLRRIPKPAAQAALWVIYPKGVEAIREIAVIEAGRTAGLKDTKVARFSDTHTALRFSR